MTITHWTERSPEDFLYSIASDFVEQLRAKMKTLNMSQSKLAKAANVSKGYVSQVFNDPGNLTLITIVKFAKAAGMKVSVVGYEDDDADSERGPIDSTVFRACWEKANRPQDLRSVFESSAITDQSKVYYWLPPGRHGYTNASHPIGQIREVQNVIKEFDWTKPIVKSLPGLRGASDAGINTITL